MTLEWKEVLSEFRKPPCNQLPQSWLALGKLKIIGVTFMAAVKELASFTVQRKGENYRITLEDENGDTIEYTADYVALDQVSEAVDGALESDDDEEIEFEEDDDDV